MTDQQKPAAELSPRDKQPGNLERVWKATTNNFLLLFHKQLVRTYRGYVFGIARVLLFAGGFTIFAILAALIFSVLAHGYAVTAYLLFIVGTAFGIFGGLLIVFLFRNRLSDTFSADDMKRLERVKVWYLERLASLDDQAADMRGYGATWHEINAKLGPALDATRDAYRAELDNVAKPKGILVPALPPGEPEPAALGPDTKAKT